MSKSFGVLPLLLSIVLALAAAVPAQAVSAPRGGSALQSRSFGRTFSRPAYRTSPRSRSTRSPYSRSYRRTRSPFHGLGGAILKGLGLAYLFHALFGWGGGGSPLGLLLLVAIIAYLVGRARRPRRPAYY